MNINIKRIDLKQNDLTIIYDYSKYKYDNEKILEFLYQVYCTTLKNKNKEVA